MALIFPEDEQQKAMTGQHRRLVESFHHMNFAYDFSKSMPQLEADKKSLMDFVRKLQDGKSWH